MTSTIGERNRSIIRLHKKGMNAREIAEELDMLTPTVQKVIQNYNKSGDSVFESETKWQSTPPPSIQSREEYIAEQFRKSFCLLQKTISEGDQVKFWRDNKFIVATVCDVLPHLVVVRDLRKPPCEKCEKCGSECERICKGTYHAPRLFDICRIYWLWFNRLRVYCPTYVDLTSKGGEID